MIDLPEVLMGSPGPEPPSVVFGTVETSSPLTVRVGVDTEPTPAVGQGGLTPGQRVVCMIARRRLIVISTIGDTPACPYRVGDLYLTALSANPSATWPGTAWVRHGEGRALVGVSATDADFTLGKTGGSKTHQLTTAEIPSHSHTITGSRSGTNEYYQPYPPWTNPGASGTAAMAGNAAGGGGAHNNLQPYIAVNVWRRTA